MHEAMTDLHVHFHGDVAAGATLVIQVPPTGAIAAQLNQLKELITMDMQALKTALEGVSTQLTDTSTQLEKATNEIVVAISNSGNTTAEVDAAVAKLQQLGTGLKTLAQGLDDLNADAPA